MDDPIDDLTLERLEDNGAIARDELGLAVARDDHALAYVRDGYDGDDEAKLAGAGALDVGIELRLEVLLHARSEVGRVQHDRMRELFLQRENWNAWLMGCERAREKKRRVTIKNIALWCSSWVRRRCVVTVVVGFLTVSRDSRRGRAFGRSDATPLFRSLAHTVQHCGTPSVPILPSMLQGLASRTRNCIHRVHPRPVNGLGRPARLVSGGYALAVLSIRHYAQIPPGGQGPGGSGGFPGFKFPMQQQYAKGDALKEFVRALLRKFLRVFSPVLPTLLP